MMKKLLMSMLCAIMCIGVVTAQTTTVTGVVTSAEDGAPIIGASVLVKGTSMGTVTDLDGQFTINNVPTTAKILAISYIGMTSKEVAIQSGLINVALQSDNRLLDEVVVVGYGTQRREAKTGSITTVSSEQLSNLVGSSFDKMLSGKMAGVQITAASGQPGANSEIRIRGISSINAKSEPLYVVDGVAVMSGNQSYFTNTGNAISAINPNDIESITVLKDAAAASIYGSRAANGVILVTTKSGKEGKSRFNVRMKYGASKLANDNDFGVMNGQELAGYRRQAVINSGRNPDDPNVGGTYYYPSNFMDGKTDTDWVDHFTKSGTLQEYEISATGGGAKTTYFNSLSYHKNEGIFYGITFERMQARVNVDHELSNNLKTGVRVNLAYMDTEDVPMQALYFSNPLFAGMTIQPWSKPYNEDGTHNVNITENSNTNPRATALYDDQWEKQYRFNGNIYLQWAPIKGLTLRTTNAAEMSFADGRRYWSPETSRGTATLQTSITKYQLLTTSNTATYENLFNDVHSFRILGGQEAIKSSYNSEYVYAPGVDPDIPHVNTAPVADVEASIEKRAHTLLSFFGVADYNYAARYYLQASLRYDGSSLFGADERWGLFYSVGTSWNAHNEVFMEDYDWMDMMKVRASYGLNGNNSIDEYMQYGLYTPSQYNGSAGLRPTSPENATLTWEKSASWNVGIDYGFLKRFSGSIDFYTRKTTDMLLDRPLSYTSGFNTQKQNVGSLRNAGIEFQFEATIIDNKDWLWSAGLNLSHNKSKILDLAGDEMINYYDPVLDDTNDQIKHIKGKSLLTYYLREYYGVNPVNGEALFVTEDGSLTNNFNQARFIEAGSPEPKLTGGLNTNVSWKDLSLSVQFEGKFGNKVLIGENRYLHSDANQMSMNMSKSALNYWKQPGDTGVNPKPVAGNTSSSYSNLTTRFLEKGDFVRVKDITLAYNLPQKWINTAGISGLRVYASAYNLYTFHDVNYWDPERGIAGMGYGIYPMTKSFIFGLDLSF